MQITITGTPTKVTVHQCRTALRYFAKRLVSPRLYASLTIKLEFIPRFTVKADCVWNDSPYRGRSYTIRIRANLYEKQMLLSLAHEMVHVMQWATGIMSDSWRDPDKTTWRGKKFYMNTNADYWEAPWEIEAYGREIGLYKMFKEDLKNDVCRWRRYRSGQRCNSYQRARA